jgi:hypothetical protein
MKINTDTKLKDLKGKDLELTVGDALANIVVSHKDGGQMKVFVLAQKFATQKAVDVDEADLSLVKKAIEKNESYLPLVTGQLLIILEKNETNKDKGTDTKTEEVAG